MRYSVNYVRSKAELVLSRAKEALNNKKGDGFVDIAVKILITVVLGGLVLTGLYMLFKNTILPNLSTKLTEMFNYKG